MMRCENCGKDLAEDAAFCPECGVRTPARSAGEIVDLAHTGGLVRERASGQVPDIPEAPEIPGSAPEFPEAAPLPDAPGMEIPGGEAASADIATGFLDKARLREERRRAAQALVETAQTELREELAEIAQDESLIEQRGYDVADVYTRQPPPPPPPSPAEEMWEDTQERAELHGVELPWSDKEEEEKQPWQKEDQRVGEKLDAAAEGTGQNCCVYGCIAFVVLMFLFFALMLIIDTV